MMNSAREAKRKVFEDLIEACNNAIMLIPRENVCEENYAKFRESLILAMEKSKILSTDFYILKRDFETIKDHIIPRYPDDREWSREDIVSWSGLLQRLRDETIVVAKPHLTKLGNAKLKGT